MSRQQAQPDYRLNLDWRLEWEERSAIREYDGGLNRRDAEQAAIEEILGRIGNNEYTDLLRDRLTGTK